MMREIEQFYSTQIEEMPMYVQLISTNMKNMLTIIQERCGPHLSFLFHTFTVSGFRIQAR